MRHINLSVLLVAIACMPYSVLARPQKIASVPFEIVGSYIVVNVSVNGSEPLNLILDSGVRYSIITELTPDDSVALNYTRKTKLAGLGDGEGLEALVSVNNTLSLGNFELTNKVVYALSEDIFNLSRHTGSRINGLIGFDIFPGHVVKIDYSNQRIVFYDSDGFEAPKGYTALPIIIDGQKMFVNINLFSSEPESHKRKMLVDTGAELAMWLRAYGDDAVEMPEVKIRGLIGQGINGEIRGYLGRVRNMSIGRYSINNVVVSFPDSASLGSLINHTNRDGTLGSQLLNRFNIYIDFDRSMLYLRPNKNFKNEFGYNVAGVELVQNKTDINSLEVVDVWEGSPGEIAGIKKGDRIVAVDQLIMNTLTLNDVNAIFRKSSKRPVNVMVLRENKSVNLLLKLQNRI